MFVLQDAELQELVANGTKEKVEFDTLQFNQSKELIKKQVKANIARDLWSSNEYYQIMNTENDIYNKAVDLLSSKTKYDNALHRKRE